MNDEVDDIGKFGVVMPSGNLGLVLMETRRQSHTSPIQILAWTTKQRERKTTELNTRTYEIMTRADFRALVMTGCLAIRGVPARLDMRA